MNADCARPALGCAHERRHGAVEMLNAVTVVAGEKLAQSTSAHDAVRLARRLADALVAVPVAVRNVLQLRLHNTTRHGDVSDTQHNATL